MWEQDSFNTCTVQVYALLCVSLHVVNVLIWCCSGYCFCFQYCTVKILTIGIPKITTVIVKKKEQFGLINALMCPIGADGMANSVEPDQTAPEGAV